MTPEAKALLLEACLREAEKLVPPSMVEESKKAWRSSANDFKGAEAYGSTAYMTYCRAIQSNTAWGDLTPQQQVGWMVAAIRIAQMEALRWMMQGAQRSSTQ